MQIFDWTRVYAPNSCIVQGSTVFLFCPSFFQGPVCNSSPNQARHISLSYLLSSKPLFKIKIHDDGIQTKNSHWHSSKKKKKGSSFCTSTYFHTNYLCVQTSIISQWSVTCHSLKHPSCHPGEASTSCWRYLKRKRKKGVLPTLSNNKNYTVNLIFLILPTEFYAINILYNYS